MTYPISDTENDFLGWYRGKELRFSTLEGRDMIRETINNYKIMIEKMIEQHEKDLEVIASI